MEHIDRADAVGQSWRSVPAGKRSLRNRTHKEKPDEAAGISQKGGGMKKGGLTTNPWGENQPPATTVWCFCCEQWDAGNRSQIVAATEFRHSGWTTDEAGLWMCPECSSLFPTAGIGEWTTGSCEAFRGVGRK
jgi:hypothetical protein